MSARVVRVATNVGFISFFPAIQLGAEAFPTAHVEPRRDLRECQRCFPPQPRRQDQL